jgi:hypothetical protein
MTSPNGCPQNDTLWRKTKPPHVSLLTHIERRQLLATRAKSCGKKNPEGGLRILDLPSLDQL